MTDLEWATAFVRCKIKGTGIRLGDTVDVLVKKLAEVRSEAAGKAPLTRLRAEAPEGSQVPLNTSAGAGPPVRRRSTSPLGEVVAWRDSDPEKQQPLREERSVRGEGSLRGSTDSRGYTLPTGWHV